MDPIEEDNSKMPRQTPLWGKLQQLWLSGHTAEEAFKITNAGMTRVQQNRNFGIDYVGRIFRAWNTGASSTGRAIMVVHLQRIRDTIRNA